MWKKFIHKYINPIHHIINPLHVYCRLVELNIMSIRKAKIINKIYDKIFYKVIYPFTNKRR